MCLYICTCIHYVHIYVLYICIQIYVYMYIHLLRSLDEQINRQAPSDVPRQSEYNTWLCGVCMVPASSTGASDSGRDSSWDGPPPLCHRPGSAATTRSATAARPPTLASSKRTRARGASPSSGARSIAVLCFPPHSQFHTDSHQDTRAQSHSCKKGHRKTQTLYAVPHRDSERERARDFCNASQQFLKLETVPIRGQLN